MSRRNGSIPSTTESLDSARAAGLRYVSDAAPGIRRCRTGSGFTYVGPHGRVVRDRATIDRIKHLAIPPAWTDVWICPDPRGHIQAVGRDDRGRKQYRYHEKWRTTRDEAKYEKMIDFARALPAIRRKTREHLKLPG